jgi:hypothetical protein
VLSVHIPIRLLVLVMDTVNILPLAFILYFSINFCNLRNKIDLKFKHRITLSKYKIISWLYKVSNCRTNIPDPLSFGLKINVTKQQVNMVCIFIYKIPMYIYIHIYLLTHSLHGAGYYSLQS